jgi:hypothetical protein
MFWLDWEEMAGAKCEKGLGSGADDLNAEGLRVVKSKGKGYLTERV